MKALSVQVPLPPRYLSPNNGNNSWAAKRRAEYRADIARRAREVAALCGWEPPAKVRVSLVFGTKRDREYRKKQMLLKEKRRDYCPEDPSNAISAFKAGIDGLVDAGLFSDDNFRVMTLGSVDIRPDQGPWVRVTVEAINETR